MTKEIDDAIRTLQRIWNRPNTGYVFLPYIPEEAARGTKNERKKAWTEGRAFKLGDWDTIRAHITRHWNDDLYFTPMVFSRPQRTRENAKATSRLWADLDGADPREIDPVLYPTIAWETSPGRYAAVWCMGAIRPETTERGGENHRLTIAVGADPSGWDTTQLLRVPGSRNNKREYQANTRGLLMWRERGSCSWDSVDELPELPLKDTLGGDLIDEAALEAIDPYQAYARLRRKLPGIVRQYMRLKDADESMDRSSVAWQIERSLADAGATLLEMVAIIRPTPWNKHYGRRDELKRLTLECGKALAAKKEQPNKAVLEADEVVKHKLIPFWNNEAYLNAPEPEWLYEEFIPRGGCGFISGIPKSMKTWFAMDLCISAALGVNYLGYQVEKAVNVLYVQREDPTTLVRNRHHVIASSKHDRWSLNVPQRDLKPYPGALFVETNLGIDVSDEGWQVWLAEQIRQAQLDLVIFDTLVRSAPGVDFDSATSATAQVLNPVKEIARENNCAIAFVHHNTKAQSNQRAAQNMAGSGQIHAWADFGIYITEKREALDWVEVDFTHETKYTGTRELRFRMEGLPDRWDPEEKLIELPPKEKMKDNPSHDELDNRVPAAIRIRKYFRANPNATGQQAADDLGLGIRTIRRFHKSKA
jgi:hypothetical protein